MREPVFTADGATYERRAIETWLSSGHTTSPITNEPLPELVLVPNKMARSLILAFVEKNPHLAECKHFLFLASAAAAAKT